jgi:DNA-binding NarL/FixJ family response regulator
MERTKKIKVFIADGSPVVLDRMAELLKDVPGAELVGKSSDVSEAVGWILTIKPDAIILGMHMRGGSGLDVLRAVRSDHLPHLQVVFCSNDPEIHYREESMNAGANFFLDKSVDFEKIPAILRELIQKDGKLSG